MSLYYRGDESVQPEDDGGLESRALSAAELTDWLRYLLCAVAKGIQELEDVTDKVRNSLGVLVKLIGGPESVERLATDGALRTL